MTIYFRVDANKTIGAGHLSRCSNLALALKSLGVESKFIVNKNNFIQFDYMPPMQYEFISANSLDEDAAETIKVLSKESFASLVIDSYLHDEKWEKKLKPYVKKLLVWDDLANRKHCCDILVDCGFQRNESDYRDLVGTNTTMLIGSRFCPISPNLRKISNENPISGKIHLFFGSLDIGHLAFDYYEEIIKTFHGHSVNIALANQPSPILLERWTKMKRAGDELYISKPIGESLKGCQIAIGAPGVTTWERAYLGIFGFYISTNVNQVPILLQMEKLGMCKYVGDTDDSPQRNISKIQRGMNSLDISVVGQKCKELVDGLGLERIAKEVLR